MIKVILLIIGAYLVFAMGSMYGLGVGSIAERAIKENLDVSFEQAVEYYYDDFPWFTRVLLRVVKYGIRCGKSSLE